MLPMVAAEASQVFENYRCPETGQVIQSERQRREVMAKHDLIDARETGTGREHIARAKAKNKAQREKCADPNVTTEYTDLTT